MEPQGPQHLLQLDQPQVVQFAHLIWQLHGLHVDDKNSHTHAYVNPLLIFRVTLLQKHDFHTTSIMSKMII